MKIVLSTLENRKKTEEELQGELDRCNNLIEVITAYRNGKMIQCKGQFETRWHDVHISTGGFNIWNPLEMRYRVKPCVDVKKENFEVLLKDLKDEFDLMIKKIKELF